MKAADIKKDDHLYWKRGKYGAGRRVRVLDPRPVFGRRSRYRWEVVEGHGRGVLCVLVSQAGADEGEPIAVPLGQLLGPWEETDRRIKKQEREDERARRAEQQRAAEARGYGERLRTRARKLGVSVYATERFGRISISVGGEDFEAMLDALDAQGWTHSTDD